MLRKTAISALVTVVLFLMMSGCYEVPTGMKIGSGPSFEFSGSGRLASFRVYGPQSGRKIATPFDSASLVWCIQAADGYFNGAPVRHLQIAYGTVPKGYSQTVPVRGPASTLLPGRIYYVFAETTDAPPASGFFYMDGSAPIETAVPGLCQSGFTGDVKPLKCGTNEPFQEPTNLLGMVQQNRIKR